MTSLRTWSITLATAVLTAAVLLGAVVLIVGVKQDSPTAATPAPVNAAGGPAPVGAAPAAKRSPAVGPEGVPLTRGAPLGPARSPAPGSSSGGIPCGAREQLTYHVHARLTIFINGKPRSVPLGIGIAPPLRITKTANGSFAASGRCFSFLHTHVADGVIHIEAPGPITFKLGQFFAVWRQRLDSRHLGSSSGRVRAYVNGRLYHGDPRAIPLRRHVQIQLELGRPWVRPARVSFPPGL